MTNTSIYKNNGFSFISLKSLILSKNFQFQNTKALFSCWVTFYYWYPDSKFWFFLKKCLNESKDCPDSRHNMNLSKWQESDEAWLCQGSSVDVKTKSSGVKGLVSSVWIISSTLSILDRHLSNNVFICKVFPLCFLATVLSLLKCNY